MKFFPIFLIALLITISSALAGGSAGDQSDSLQSKFLAIAGQLGSNCDSYNYDNCYEYRFSLNGAVAHPKFEIDDPYCVAKKDGKCYTDETEFNYKCEGDKLYLTQGKYAECSAQGCVGEEINIEGKRTISDNPYFTCWDKDFNNQGGWAWSWAGWTYPQDYEHSSTLIEDTPETEEENQPEIKQEFTIQSFINKIIEFIKSILAR